MGLITTSVMFGTRLGCRSFSDHVGELEIEFWVVGSRSKFALSALTHGRTRFPGALPQAFAECALGAQSTELTFFRLAATRD